MIDISGLLNKIENKGATAQGKLSAEEFNLLVSAVQENQGGVRSVSYNYGNKVFPDESGNVNLVIVDSNYELSLKTTVDGEAPYRVALGNSYNMYIELSNKYIDDEGITSVSTACTITYYCNGMIVGTQEAYDGDTVQFDFGKHFTEGKNVIYANVNNNYGEIQNTLTYEVNAIYLVVELPNFNPTEIKSGDSWTLDIKVVGANANIYIFIDDEGGFIGQQNAGSTVEYTITQGIFTGTHKLKVYATAVDDPTVQTDPVVYEYIYAHVDSTQTVIATSLLNNSIYQLYETLTVEYWIYKPNFTGTLPITISITDDMGESLTHSIQNVEFTNGLTGVKKWDVALFETILIGDRKVLFEIDSITREVPITISESTVELNQIDGYKVLLRSAGRSNDDEDVKDWSYGQYKVTFPEDMEFSDIASGWNRDNDGNIALHLRRGREISLNYYPFIENPAYGNGIDVPGNKKGMTFSIEFATRNCVKRDASVVRCIHNNIGFEFYANSMMFASNSESLVVDYKEDTRVRIDLVIEGQPITYTYDDNGVTKTSDEARMIVYVDGVYQQMLLLSNVSNFMQSIPQPITIGSEYCDVDVYCIRAYETALDMKGITDNYSFDTPNVGEKIKIAKRCNVFDSSLNVSYSKLVEARPDLPIMLIGMETLPNSKTKIPVATTAYDNPLNPDDYEAGNPSWTSANDEMGNQGTSSMNYPMPYRNFDWKSLSKAFMIGGKSYKKIPLYAGMPGISKLTFKKDYASSEMANNIICSEMYNDMAVGLKDTYPDCLNAAQQSLSVDKYRLALKGVPFFIFKYWNNEYTPMGMFNFIPNKNEHEYLGFTSPYTWETSRAQSWEIRDNNIFWDFYMNEAYWDASQNKAVNDIFTYYEAIYPKDNTTETSDFGDATNVGEIENAKNETRDLLRLHNWLVSTNQSLANGSLLEEPYTDSLGVTYNYDTATYRLAKFQNEYKDYLVLDQWILYYIWREQFWMFDSGSKNLQIHTYDGIHWGCHVRDADTALGIDNEGRFVFPPYLEDVDYRRGNEFIFNQKTKPQDADTVLNGQLGAIWINIRDGFGDRIQQMYVTLYDNAASTNFNYDKTIKRFEDHQGAWSEALYNFGSHQYYGGAPYSKWISSGLGDKKNQRRYWLYYGFKYRASKYHAGSSINRITWRQFGTGSDLQMKTYSQMYVSLGFGAYDYKTTKRYRCLDLENGVTVKNEFTTNVSDVVMYLFNGDMITDIGNLYEFGNIGSLDLTYAIRLRSLKVGNKDDKNKYINTKLTSLVLSSCDALEYLDLTSCQGFGTGTGQNGIYTLDLSNLTLLQELYCSNSSMSGITFPETPSLRTVHIGNNISRLRLINLTNLNEFKMDSGEKIQSVIIKNSGNVSKTHSYNILGEILAIENNKLTEIEIDGIDWQDASAEIVETLCDKHANLKGKINIIGANQMTFALKRKLIAEYGNIDDENNPLHITYEKRDILSINMSPKQYFTEVGEYQLNYTVDPIYANNYLYEKWSLGVNLYATVDENTGVLKVNRIGEGIDGVGPNATVTVTVYLTDGSTITSTSELNFWKRVCQLGDVVYHDGSFSSVNDYSLETASGKIAIGICFYIHPTNPTKRLMVALRDIPSGQYWGIVSSALPDIVLTDYPGTSVYDIAAIPNLNGFGASSWESLRDTVTGDEDGWAYFDPTTESAGQIGWMTVKTAGAGYNINDSVPYGKYYTAHVIDVRNKVLQDPQFNLEIPAKTDSTPETNILTQLLNSVQTSLSVVHKQLYYPIISYCYAYSPTTNRNLKDEFKEHNWWLPTFGELARLGYYYQEYYNPNNSDGVKNSFNIFKDAIDSGIMSPFTTSASYSTINENYTSSQIQILAMYNTSYGKWYPATSIKNGTSRLARPICMF